jgi:hypothetical protein
MSEIKFTERELKDGRTIKLYHSIKNNRLEDETQEEYTIRRRLMKKFIKQRMAFKIWDSKQLGSLDIFSVNKLKQNKE